ncbi:hypothetical protein ACE0DR_20850 [Azotobacter sp. CWF10]
MMILGSARDLEARCLVRPRPGQQIKGRQVACLHMQTVVAQGEGNTFVLGPSDDCECIHGTLPEQRIGMQGEQGARKRPKQ